MPQPNRHEPQRPAHKAHSRCLDFPPPYLSSQLLPLLQNPSQFTPQVVTSFVPTQGTGLRAWIRPVDNKVSILVSFPSSCFGDVALMGALSYNEYSALTVPTSHRFWQQQAARRQTTASGCHMSRNASQAPKTTRSTSPASPHPLGPPVNYPDEQNRTNQSINTSFIYRCRGQAHTYLFIHLKMTYFSLLCTSLIPPALLWPRDCQTCKSHLFIMPASPTPAVQDTCPIPLIHCILFLPTKHN